MKTADPENESALRARIEQSNRWLDALAGELRAIDDELAGDRQQYALLQEACGALEKLDEQDAAGLFWNELAAVDAGQVHVRSVRQRVAAFQHRLSQIEVGRRAVLAKIEREAEKGEFLEDDLRELKSLEESRKREWIVEREMSSLPERPCVMPWTRGGEEDQRFRRTLALALLLSLLFSVLFPWIPLPLPDRWKVIELPDRLTHLIREERTVTPPPVQELRPEEPKPVEETPLVAEEVAPEPTPNREPPKPSAGSKGILAFREQFSSLADNAATARLGSQARITRSGELASGRPTRSLVTTQVPSSCVGIDLASLSRDVGGGGRGIEGVQITRATSSIRAIGGGGNRPLSGGPGSARTDEEIQIVFDRHKAALYRLYNRELRRDPTLHGQMVLHLTIEPDGSVSLCELQSSDMKAPQLATQIVERVKTFDFGAKDGIPAITILYPIDFLPAT